MIFMWTQISNYGHTPMWKPQDSCWLNWKQHKITWLLFQFT